MAEDRAPQFKCSVMSSIHPLPIHPPLRIVQQSISLLLCSSAQRGIDLMESIRPGVASIEVRADRPCSYGSFDLCQHLGRLTGRGGASRTRRDSRVVGCGRRTAALRATCNVALREGAWSQASFVSSLLKYSWFIMLCLISAVQQSDSIIHAHTYIYMLFSVTVYRRVRIHHCKAIILQLKVNKL